MTEKVVQILLRIVCILIFFSNESIRNCKMKLYNRFRNAGELALIID